MCAPCAGGHVTIIFQQHAWIVASNTFSAALPILYHYLMVLILSCLQMAKDAGVAFLSLPECFSFIGSREGESLTIAEPLDGPILTRYRELAR